MIKQLCLGKNIVQLHMIKIYHIAIFVPHTMQQKLKTIMSIIYYSILLKRNKEKTILWSWTSEYLYWLLSIIVSIEVSPKTTISYLIIQYNFDFHFQYQYAFQDAVGENDSVMSIQWFMKILFVWMILENSFEYYWLE
jgi:hypothetical protein